MPRNICILPFCLAALLLLLGGCTSSASARKVISLDRFERIFVERRLNDNNHIDQIFVNELRRLGKEASSGPMTMMPDKTDLILTYDARWQWDFKNYVIELNFDLHTVYPHKKVADGRYHQPSIRTRSPDEMIRELLGRLFTRP